MLLRPWIRRFIIIISLLGSFQKHHMKVVFTDHAYLLVEILCQFIASILPFFFFICFEKDSLRENDVIGERQVKDA